MKRRQCLSAECVASFPRSSRRRVIEHDAQALEARRDAATQAESAYEIAAKRYAAGGISQLALLDAQRHQLETVLDRITY